MGFTASHQPWTCSFLTLIALLTKGTMVFADGSTIVASPRYDREHIYFQLENGLKVMTISDRKAEQATVGLTVSVGTRDDPVNTPGLSHLLEHMLLRGTGRGRQSFNDCWKDHGGIGNGMTRYSSTHYYFSVEDQSLDDVFQCFVSMLSTSLFHKKEVAQELAAVDAEYRSRHMSGTQPYNKAALKISVNPAHPFAHAFSGSSESLGTDIQYLVTRLEELLSSTYQPGRMGLVVMADRPPKELRKLVTHHFKDLHGSGVKRTKNIPLFQKESLPHVLHYQYEPDVQDPWFTLAFPIPYSVAIYRQKPHEYVLARFRDDHPNGLVQTLHKRGWITGLRAKMVNIDPSTVLSVVSFKLTKDGVSQVDAIGAAFFAYIDHLLANGIDQDLFNEHRKAARLAFNFHPGPDPVPYVRQLSHRLLLYPPRDVARVGAAWDEFSPDSIAEVLRAHNPDNVMATLSERRVDGDVCGHWLTFPCKKASLPSDWYELWQDKTPRLGFVLPAPNPFMPESTKMLPDTQSREVLTAADDRIRATHIVDTSFGVPLATAYIRLRSANTCSTPREGAFSAILREYILDGTIDVRHAAHSLAYKSSVTSEPMGLTLMVHGYNDKLPKLAESVLKVVTKRRLRPAAFEAYRAHLLKSAGRVRTAIGAKPYQTLETETLQAIQGTHCSPLRYAEVLHTIDYREFQEWVDEFRSTLRVRALFHGNFRLDQTKRLIEFLGKRILLPAEEQGKTTSIAFQLRDTRIRREIDIVHDDGAVVVGVPARDGSAEEHMRYRVTLFLVDFVLRNELRETGLSYVALATLREIQGVPVILMIAESPQANSKALLRRVESALIDFKPKVRHVLRRRFQRLKKAALKVNRPRIVSLAHRSADLWRGLGSRGVTHKELKQAAAGLHRRDVKRCYRELIRALRHRSVTMLAAD